MTPGARAAAAIEILERVTRVSEPAEDVLRLWGRTHRFAGSKDRKAIADLVYRGLRLRARAEWRLGGGARAMVLEATSAEEGGSDALFTGQGHDPPPLTAEERAAFDHPPPEPEWARAGAPPWICARYEARFGADWMEEAAAATLERAPVDLRVNALCGAPAGALKLLAHEDVAPAATSFSSLGLRLPPTFARDVHVLKAFTTGWIEVQDEASQIGAFLADARPGEFVIDYCAGAGGKTLALAGEMAGAGRLLASDVDARRLAAMDERLIRARAPVERRRLGPSGEGMEDLIGQADRVFVDAPCSGSGTWRRRPEAAWRLTPESLERLTRLQGDILERARRLVRPGGRLVYATCSMLGEENEEVAGRFLARHPEFRPAPIARAAASPRLRPEGRARLAALAADGHTLQLTPRRTGTDGFFVAIFERSE